MKYIVSDLISKTATNLKNVVCFSVGRQIEWALLSSKKCVITAAQAIKKQIQTQERSDFGYMMKRV